jgi:predicted RNase H-like HicB family nuclease
MKYLVNIIYDPEFKGYVADVPSLPGCMSQGKTIEKTLANVREAIRAYLAASADSPIQPSQNVLVTQIEV